MVHSRKKLMKRQPPLSARVVLTPELVFEAPTKDLLRAVAYREERMDERTAQLLISLVNKGRTDGQFTDHFESLRAHKRGFLISINGPSRSLKSTLVKTAIREIVREEEERFEWNEKPKWIDQRLEDYAPSMYREQKDYRATRRGDQIDPEFLESLYVRAGLLRFYNQVLPTLQSGDFYVFDRDSVLSAWIWAGVREPDKKDRARSLRILRRAAAYKYVGKDANGKFMDGVSLLVMCSPEVSWAREEYRRNAGNASSAEKTEKQFRLIYDECRELERRLGDDLIIINTDPVISEGETSLNIHCERIKEQVGKEVRQPIQEYLTREHAFRTLLANK